MKTHAFVAATLLALSPGIQAQYSTGGQPYYQLGITGNPNYLVAYHCSEGASEPKLYRVNAKQPAIAQLMKGTESHFNQNLTWASERSAYRDNQRVRVKAIAVGTLDARQPKNDTMVHGEFHLDKVLMTGRFDERFLSCSL